MHGFSIDQYFFVHFTWNGFEIFIWFPSFFSGFSHFHSRSANWPNDQPIDRSMRLVRMNQRNNCPCQFPTKKEWKRKPFFSLRSTFAAKILPVFRIPLCVRNFPQLFYSSIFCGLFAAALYHYAELEPVRKEWRMCTQACSLILW